MIFEKEKGNKSWQKYSRKESINTFTLISEKRNKQIDSEKELILYKDKITIARTQH